MPSGLSMFCENGPTFERPLSGEEQAFHASRHFSDIYLLIEMLSIHCLPVEAAQTFERAVARRAFGPQSVAMVLEGRLSQYVAKNFQQPDLLVEGETSEQLRAKGDDITSVLGLAETLTFSRDLHVKGFVKTLYAV
ncbi:TRAF-like family [Olea europaea subsp. europaea]|uniref:TRAF-like family n=1 Tax=Olea europaea subsp. europaea TaxID=158383 RepID=A0A8S0VAU0_OLEEU|nr:TRAF-like family [Olea europaea subsp. europaea]